MWVGEELERCGGEVTGGWNESELVGHEREFGVPSELHGTWLDSLRREVVWYVLMGSL